MINKLPRRKQRGIKGHSVLDTESNPFLYPPERTAPAGMKTRQAEGKNRVRFNQIRPNTWLLFGIYLFNFFLDKTHKIDKMDNKHFKELMNRESINLLSTGKASKLLSVTPDTILKWIKQDKLPALRTAGGHYRVSQEAINALLSQSEETFSASQPAPEEPLLYCWEFFAENCKGSL